MKTYVVSRLLQWLYRNYFAGLLIELPTLENNVALRNELVSAAKIVATNQAHKYVRDYVLEQSMRKTAFQSKDIIEMAFNRGIAHGIQLYDQRMNELASVDKSNG